MTVDVAPLAPGDDFLGYRVVAELARGGSARVYHVQNTLTGLDYALKLITNNRGDDLRRRARDEFLILDKLQHPNVVRVFHAGITNDERFVYIQMELLAGHTLHDIRRRVRCLTVPEVLHIGIQICEAAAAAHRLDVVHRDFKPKNVFLCPGNVVKVLDFGIAKFLTVHRDTTGRLRWHGTPLYMAPEQLLGERATPRTDVYSIGVMLYELLYGTHYCLAGGGLPMGSEIGHIQINKVATPLKELISGAAVVATSDVIERAMAKKAEQRWGSASEFGEALRHAQSELKDAAARSGLVLNLRALVSEATSRPAPPWRASTEEPARVKDATSWSQAGTLEADVGALFQQATVHDGPPRPDVWQVDSESGVVPTRVAEAASVSEAAREEADSDTISDTVESTAIASDEDELQLTVPGVPLAIRQASVATSAATPDSPPPYRRRPAQTLRLGTLAPNVVYAPAHRPAPSRTGNSAPRERAQLEPPAPSREANVARRSPQRFAPQQTPTPVSSSSRLPRPGRAPIPRWLSALAAAAIGLTLAVPIAFLISRVLEWNRGDRAPNSSDRPERVLPTPPSAGAPATPEPTRAPHPPAAPELAPAPPVPPPAATAEAPPAAADPNPSTAPAEPTQPAPARPAAPAPASAVAQAEASPRAATRSPSARPQPSTTSSARRPAARARAKTKPSAPDREHELIFPY